MQDYQERGHSSHTADEYRRRRDENAYNMLYRFQDATVVDLENTNMQDPDNLFDDSSVATTSRTLTPPGSGPGTPPEPSSSPPASFKEMLIEKWIAAVGCFHQHQIEEAHRRLKDLIDSCIKEDYTHPSSGILCANVGILHWHLGEVADARRYILAAIDQQPTLAIHRFLYGCVCIEMEAWQAAWIGFEQCIKLFDDDGKAIDYKGMGLEFVLEREKVAFNLDVAHGKTVYDDGILAGIWRLPGGRIFEPIHDGEQGGTIGRKYGGAVDV